MSRTPKIHTGPKSKRTKSIVYRHGIMTYPSRRTIKNPIMATRFTRFRPTTATIPFKAMTVPYGKKGKVSYMRKSYMAIVHRKRKKVTKKRNLAIIPKKRPSVVKKRKIHHRAFHGIKPPKIHMPKHNPIPSFKKGSTAGIGFENALKSIERKLIHQKKLF